MKNRVQAIVASLLTALLIASSALGAVPAVEPPEVLPLATASAEPTELEKHLDPNVQLRVKFDYHDVIQLGKPLPAFVTVENQGDAIEGDIHIRLYNEAGEAVDYVQAVSVPANGTVEVEVPVYIMERMANIPVYLFRDGQAIAKTLKKPRYTEAKTIAILSHRPQDVAYLKKTTVISQQTQGYQLGLEYTNLDAATFPDRPYYMDRLDAIIMHHFAWSELDEMQQKALKAWVSKGGVLIVDADPTSPAVETLQAFTDIEAVEAGETYTVNEMVDALEVGIGATPSGTVATQAETVATQAAETVATLSGAVKTGKWASGGEVRAKVGAQPLISAYSFGDGELVVTAFDMGGSFLEQANLSKTVMIRYFLAHWFRSQNGMIYQPYIDWNEMANAAKKIAWNAPPALSWVAIICAAFILCVGPISYFIMKKLDKRDWIWGIAPALAVLCAVIFIGIGYRQRGTKPISSAVHILNSNGTEQWSGNSYIGVGVPRSGEYEIAVQEPGFAVHGMAEYYEMYYGSSMIPPGMVNQQLDEAKDVRIIRQNPKPSETFSHIPQWSMNGFRILRDLELEGGLMCRVYVGREEKIFYEVTNQTGYDLDDVAIVSTTKHHRIDFLANGETKTGEVDQKNADYPNYGYFEIWPLIDKLYGDKFDADGKWVEKPDVQKKSDEKKQMLLRTLANQFQGGDTGSTMVFAWSQEIGAMEAVVNGQKAISKDNFALLVNTTPMEFGGDGVLAIPEGYLQGRIVESTMNNMMIGGDANYIFLPEGSIIIEFGIPDHEKYDVEELAFSAVDVMGKFDFALYNVQTSQWDEYKLGKRIKDGGAPQYVSQTGAVQIRVSAPEREADGDEADVVPPPQTAIGGGATAVAVVEESSMNGLSMQVRGKEKADAGN